MDYVISDIHGDLIKFKEILKKIDFKDYDKLYVLGDIIDNIYDNKNESIELLLYMSQFKNIIPIIGYHEHLMYQTIMFNKDKDKWFSLNGIKTYKDYLSLDEEKQDYIKRYLSTFYLMINGLIVENNSYCLCHSVPIEILEINPKYIDYLDKSDIINICLNTKIDNLVLEGKSYLINYEHKKIILGHTPSDFLSSLVLKDNLVTFYKDKYFTCINCGNYYDKNIGCLNLNNNNEYYVD